MCFPGQKSFNNSKLLSSDFIIVVDGHIDEMINAPRDVVGMDGAHQAVFGLVSWAVPLRLPDDGIESEEPPPPPPPPPAGIPPRPARPPPGAPASSSTAAFAPALPSLSSLALAERLLDPDEPDSEDMEEAERLLGQRPPPPLAVLVESSPEPDTLPIPAGSA